MSLIDIILAVSWIVAFLLWALASIVAGMATVFTPLVMIEEAMDADRTGFCIGAVAWLVGFVALVLLIWIGTHVDPWWPSSFTAYLDEAS